LAGNGKAYYDMLEEFCTQI